MYYRKKHGRGFRFEDEKGETIKDQNLNDWFKSLVISPAWKNVKINEQKSADILVTGYDEKGRKQYIHNIMGSEFSSKDFRTWAGTLVAAIALDEMGAVEKNDQKELDKNIRTEVVKVSERMGNTPAIARSTYTICI